MFGEMRGSRVKPGMTFQSHELLFSNTAFYSNSHWLIQKSNEKKVILLNDIMSGIGAVLPVLFICCLFVFVTVQIVKYALDFLKHTDSVMQIKALLKKALKQTSGERLAIMKFYDSNPKMGCVPYNSMFCVSEAYKHGRKPVRKFLGKVPASMYILFLTNLLDGYIILDPRQNNNEIPEAIYDNAQIPDESKGLFFMIYDKNTEPAGYVSLKKADDFTNEDLKIIIDLTADVSDILDR